MSVVSAARALVDAIHASGRDAFSQLLIEAMVDQAIADGTSDPKHSAEAGGLRVTEVDREQSGARPSGSYGSIFRDPGRSPAVAPWDEDERRALEKQGCRIEAPAGIAARTAADWVRALQCADRQVIFARVTKNGSGGLGTHPLAHRLVHVLGNRSNASKIRDRRQDLLSGSAIPIGDALIRRQAARAASLPPKVPAWSVSAGTLNTPQGPERKRDLVGLLACPMKWLLADCREHELSDVQVDAFPVRRNRSRSPERKLPACQRTAALGPSQPLFALRSPAGASIRHPCFSSARRSSSSHGATARLRRTLKIEPSRIRLAGPQIAPGGLRNREPTGFGRVLRIGGAIGNGLVDHRLDQ